MANGWIEDWRLEIGDLEDGQKWALKAQRQVGPIFGLEEGGGARGYVSPCDIED